MTQAELDATRLEWARAEGWPSVKYGMPAVFSIDPNGFYKLTRSNEKVATLSAVCYLELNFAYLGFFIVPKHLRGRHYGHHLLQSVLTHSQSQRGIDNYALSCMADLAPLYEKHGFVTESEDTIWRCTNSDSSNEMTTPHRPLSNDALEQIIAYDRQVFAAQRADYLRHYLCKPNTETMIAVDDQQNIIGFGVISEREPATPEPNISHRIGPVYADNPETAQAILSALVQCTKPNETIFMETHGHNSNAAQVAKAAGFTSILKLNHMIKGKQPPAIDLAKIYCCASLVTGG